jgi:excisionase family DNA binding protein
MRSIRERLAALVDAAPPDATVPVRWLAELVDADVVDAAPGASGSPDAPAVDLTVVEVAEMFGRSTSTVRGWLASDALPGAYRLHGREWRVPRSAIEAMQAAQRKAQQRAQTPARATRTGTTDLGAWRKHVGGQDGSRAA